jgi:RimJ/RimL family protein N-acetyltransferase
LKKLAALVLGDYSVYYVYASAQKSDDPTSDAPPAGFIVRPLDRKELVHTGKHAIRHQADYAGPGSYSFGCFAGDSLVGACFYWHGPRYSLRNFWPLGEHEAKLVQIITLPEARNQGVAKRLITESLNFITRREGFHRAFARIWHSNTPSLRAFERAGWQRVALVVEINPFRRAEPFRLRSGSALFGCRPLAPTPASTHAATTQDAPPHSLRRRLSDAAGDAPSGRS